MPIPGPIGTPTPAPTPQTCDLSRTLTLRWAAPKAKLQRIEIRIKGKKYRTLSGKATTTKIGLKATAPGKFNVSVVGIARGGVSYSDSHTVYICSPTRPFDASETLRLRKG